MDATHGTNQPQWKLFTIIVCSEVSLWVPVADMPTTDETGDSIAAGLKQIRI